jgi:hypothetical protein
MESFIIWSTPKIDFRCSAVTAHLQWLQRKNNFSEHLWNSIPNSCSSQSLGASIYRLSNRMGDCSDICGFRPDGGHEPFGQTTMRQIFLKHFTEKSFLFESRVRTVRHYRPDGRTSAASNFLIRLRASRPWGMSVRTAELQHAISISVMRASRT